MTDDPSRQTNLYSLSANRRRELALALLARGNADVDGLAALRHRYPAAPDSMLHTAVHHLYVDGPQAVLDFLADAELAIQDPSHEIGYGPASELLYHVYNWLLFRAIIPEGKADLLDLLAQLEHAVKDDDRELVLATVAELRDVIDGSRQPPEMP
jgi:hypothetical protein